MSAISGRLRRHSGVAEVSWRLANDLARRRFPPSSTLGLDASSEPVSPQMDLFQLAFVIPFNAVLCIGAVKASAFIVWRSSVAWPICLAFGAVLVACVLGLILGSQLVGMRGSELRVDAVFFAIQMAAAILLFRQNAKAPSGAPIGAGKAAAVGVVLFALESAVAGLAFLLGLGVPR